MRPSSNHGIRNANLVTNSASSDSRARTVVDARGVSWEVYDDGTPSIALALDWDMPPRTGNPGLIFVSQLGQRRFWPCPEDWKGLADRDLLDLLGKAKSLT